MANLTYNPDIFNADSLDYARRIILTDEVGGTDLRWQKETPFLAEVILTEMQIRHDQLVLDYGCGIGRLARELCAKGAAVIGVDISADMRRLAADYVAMPERFLAVSPQEFDLLLSGGLQVEAAYAVWVLQHCLNPVEDLRRIFNALAANGKFLVVNNRHNRALPTRETAAWVDDGINIWTELDRHFSQQRTINYPPGMGFNPELGMIRSYLKGNRF